MGLDVLNVEPSQPKATATNSDRVDICIPAYEMSSKLARTVWFIRQTIDMPARLIVNCEKQSVAKNRNACLRVTGSNPVVFMDDDVMLPPSWLSPMIDLVESWSNLGALGPKVTSPDMTPQNSLGTIKRGELFSAPLPGMLFAYLPDRVERCLFDEAYIGSQWEDIDWMLQVRSAGLDTVCTGDIWILHDNDRKQDTSESWKQNRDYFNAKWREVLSGATGMP